MNNIIMENTTIKKKRGRKPKNKEIINENPVFDNQNTTDVIVKLDDNAIICEYNSYQKKVRYPLKYNLKKGTHTLYVQVSDRVGNRSIVKGDFYIK